jgi:glutathione-independent formaldehyde dehydrogenase
MANRGVVYKGPGRVAVEAIPEPKFENPAGRKITHGVILKVFSTNICGSDQHMVRGRTSAPAGMVLGHEITGEIIERGTDVEYQNDARKDVDGVRRAALSPKSGISIAMTTNV